MASDSPPQKCFTPFRVHGTRNYQLELPISMQKRLWKIRIWSRLLLSTKLLLCLKILFNKTWFDIIECILNLYLLIKTASENIALFPDLCPIIYRLFGMIYCHIQAPLEILTWIEILLVFVLIIIVLYVPEIPPTVTGLVTLSELGGGVLPGVPKKASPKIPKDICFSLKFTVRAWK